MVSLHREMQGQLAFILTEGNTEIFKYFIPLFFVSLCKDCFFPDSSKATIAKFTLDTQVSLDCENTEINLKYYLFMTLLSGSGLYNTLSFKSLSQLGELAGLRK